MLGYFCLLLVMYSNSSFQKRFAKSYRGRHRIKFVCNFLLCEGVAKIFWAWLLPCSEIQVQTNALQRDYVNCS